MSALLSVAPDPEREELRTLPVAAIEPNPRQPRQDFDEEALMGLAESVRARGVLQPVLVAPGIPGRYRLIAGERRWRAAQVAGLQTIPAIVRAGEDAESLELALIENMAREDLNPVEEARACAALVEELGLTRDEVGKRVGRSRVAVSNLMRLLDLPDDALALIETGSLSEGHGRALLMTSDHDERRRLATEAVTERWSVRELEDRARGGAPAAKGRRRRRKAAVHPDLEEALARLEEDLGEALGTDVRVRPTVGEGCRVELRFETVEDARAVADRLGRR